MDAAGEPTGVPPSAVSVERYRGGYLVVGRGERRHYMGVEAAYQRARELAGWLRR